MTTPESLTHWRQRLALSEHGAAQCIGVPTRIYLRWERGETRMPHAMKRLMALLEFFETRLPGEFAAFVARAGAVKKRGRPVGSRNVPEWLRPSAPASAPPGPKRPVGRPKGSKTDPRARVGRPRDPESTRPVRRACRHCGKTVIGGRLFHPDCLAESMGEVRALHADLLARQEHAHALADGGDQAVFPLPESRPSAPVEAPKACRVPVSGVACSAPCEHGYICAAHREALGMVRPV